MALIRPDTPEPVRSINIVRVRNGFMLRAADDVARHCYTSLDETFVFNRLHDVFEYLVSVDFEVTED